MLLLLLLFHDSFISISLSLGDLASVHFIDLPWFEHTHTASQVSGPVCSLAYKCR